jgi:CBS domain-containing protein
MNNSQFTLYDTAFSSALKPPQVTSRGLLSDPDFEIPLKFRDDAAVQIEHPATAPTVLRLAKGRKDVICASQTLQEAAELMQRRGIGVLPVIAGERPIGIVTDRDIVLRAVTGEKPMNELRVRDAMTCVLFTCLVDDSVQDAVDLMLVTGVHQLPVQTDIGQFWGMLSLAHCEAALKTYAKSHSDPAVDERAPPRNAAAHGTFRGSCF